GSAGFAVALTDQAGVFIDGRYREQVKSQIDLDHFTPVNWPETKLADWVIERLEDGARLAFDPWLHTVEEIRKLSKKLQEHGIELAHRDNLVDRIWTGRPPRPNAPMRPYPYEYAGQSHDEKRMALAKELKKAGHSAVVLTLPDSICWLLNIRGSDIPRNPQVQAFAILHDTGAVDLFTDAAVSPEAAAHLGPDVTLHPYGRLLEHFETLHGKVRIDPSSAPLKIEAHLQAQNASRDDAAEPVDGKDPCILPKARKNAAELAGTTEAHLRDAAAMCEFLAWLDSEAPQGALTEIDVVRKLEGFRRATNALQDISFDTICGAGPNGAIVHYRVTEKTNAMVQPGQLLLVDSGGQYLDGTTDITRTIAVGAAGPEERAAFTRVLQGMIAISRIRWPKGLAGRDLDALARAPLWMAGQDYDHGTGHGVGVFLSVHEGPQRLSRLSEVPLEEGMILSNEPGYYRPGAFGIRTENLVYVAKAPAIEGGDDRAHLAFEPLTLVPIDLGLVDAAILSPGERAWLNSYHAETLNKIAPRVSADTQDWLKRATRTI
ncbi:MAG: aminopeptidase P family protein, partial [Alphaproteobacteria bacterium]|nr:aminopeptidase P family protein [Alphaproteobacteria bacterium]